MRPCAVRVDDCFGVGRFRLRRHVLGFDLGLAVTVQMPSLQKSAPLKGRQMYGSASPDSLAEDVLILPVVVPELKFGDVERKIFGADLVECADNATLKDRPEAFNRVRMDRTDNVLVRRVADDGVRKS